MDIFDLAKEKLIPIFQSQGFEVVEESVGFVHLESPEVSVRMAQDPRESCGALFIGRKGGEHYELHRENLRSLFHVDLTVWDSSEIYLAKLGEFFQSEQGRAFLGGDLEDLVAVEQDRAAKYNRDLMDFQHTRSASQAWDAGNYAEFLELSVKISEERLTKSMLKKIEIAKRSLKCN